MQRWIHILAIINFTFNIFFYSICALTPFILISLMFIFVYLILALSGLILGQNIILVWLSFSQIESNIFRSIFIDFYRYRFKILLRSFSDIYGIDG
jgi:hypothetical protein